MKKTGDMSRESMNGSKWVESYGKDNSDVRVPDERGGKMGGSITNLAHSLSGTSANQKGS